MLIHIHRIGGYVCWLKWIGLVCLCTRFFFYVEKKTHKGNYKINKIRQIKGIIEAIGQRSLNEMAAMGTTFGIRFTNKLFCSIFITKYSLMRMDHTSFQQETSRIGKLTRITISEHQSNQWSESYV